MKKNVGNTDKLLRLIVVLIFALLSYFNIVTGLLSYILLGLSVTLLITSFINFCPLYAIFGINTHSTEENK